MKTSLSSRNLVSLSELTSLGILNVRDPYQPLHKSMNGSRTLSTAKLASSLRDTKFRDDREAETILVPVILAGGAGTRLWPISRESHPKPFIHLPDGQSLLQKTFLRACHFPDIAEIMTVTNKEYYLKSKAEYEKCAPYHALPPLSFLLEPCGRNTAPAILLAALSIVARYGKEAILLVLPADHLVETIDTFTHYCQEAFSLAQANKLVTFGITPTSPETGFGYIECGSPYPATSHGFNVARFVEKPSLTVAHTYLNSQRFLWNSGMFCFKAGLVLEQFQIHAPDLFAGAKACLAQSQKQNANPTVLEIEATSFTSLQDISIDYALMEKSQDIAVVACDFDWQDVGSWEAYKKLHPEDQHGNTVLGDAILIDSENNFIHSENRMVASIGINHLTIVDTPDALLITHRDRAQDVKQIVQTLKNKAHESYLTHRTVLRPWGSYTVLEEGPCFKIKRIVVKPGSSLSLQMHEKRSEHWVVVEGTAKVINGDKDYLLQTNESTFVSMGTPHRLSNPAETDLIVIEVQTGTYLGEDDIIRLEDTYGRTK